MKTYIFAIFVLVAIAQLFVPAHMIYEKENVLKRGESFRFKTAPVDPYDFMRGRYVTLHFEANRVKQIEPQFNRGEEVYTILKNNKSGFAEVVEVSRTAPEGDMPYLKAKIRYHLKDEVILDFPFDRYYMEESKAYETELAYMRSAADTTVISYALVNIHKGNAVLKEVYIDDVPVKEVVEQERALRP